jgi:hypothetical protein
MDDDQDEIKLHPDHKGPTYQIKNGLKYVRVRRLLALASPKWRRQLAAYKRLKTLKK